jgi:hypothetical protein
MIIKYILNKDIVTDIKNKRIRLFKPDMGNEIRVYFRVSSIIRIILNLFVAKHFAINHCA